MEPPVNEYATSSEDKNGEGEPLLFFPNDRNPEQESVLTKTQRRTLLGVFLFFVIAKGTVSAGIFFFMRVSLCRETLNVGARECQIMSIITFMPSSLRGFFAYALSGQFSLSLPRWLTCGMPCLVRTQFSLGPQNLARPVFVFGSLLAAVPVSILFIIMTWDGEEVGYVWTGFLIFLTNLGICLMDVIVCGAYTNLVHQLSSFPDKSTNESWTTRVSDFLQLRATCAPHVVMYASNAFVIGQITAAVLTGVVAETIGPNYLFLVSALLLWLIVVVYSKDDTEEFGARGREQPGFANPFYQIFNAVFENSQSTRVQTNASALPDESLVLELKYIAALTTLLALLNSFASIFTDSALLFILIAFVSAFLLLGYVYFGMHTFSLQTLTDMQTREPVNEPVSFRDCRELTFIALLFIFSYVNIDSVEAFYVTARDDAYALGKQCWKNAPRLTYLEYNTWGSILASVFCIAGNALYQRLSRKRKVVDVLLSVSWLSLCASNLDILLPVGLFDSGETANKVFFYLSYCVIGPVISQASNMYLYALLPLLSPPSNPTLGFSVCAALQSYARILSSQFGLLGIDLAQIGKDDCLQDFRNLGHLMAVAHVVLPLCFIVYVYYLNSEYAGPVFWGRLQRRISKRD